MEKENKISGKESVSLYGVNPVIEAMRAGRDIETIYIYAGRRRQVAEIEKEAQKRGIPVKIIHDAAFFDRKFPKGHQGVAASAASRTPSIDIETLLQIPAEKGEVPFFVILDLIEDPRNLGAIVRSAEAAGVHGAVIQEHRAAGLGPEAVKSSAGALEHLPVCSINNIKHAIEEMKKEDIYTVGAEADGEMTAWDADLSGPVALVIGSEGKGLRKTVKEKCDVVVSLPVYGKVNSLNTSVAAGILLYEVLRQRRAKKPTIK